MAKISIENIGPIKLIDSIDLKKINVIIGPQGSGKSTLVKIICFCKWLEKHLFLNGNDDYIKQNKEDLFNENLLEFHRLDESYFTEKSKIEYKGLFLHFVYSNNEIDITLSKNSQYRNNKLIYIPAERNIVSVLPDLDRYKDTSDNLTNFIFDWFDIKRHYTSTKSLEVLNLNIDYFYNEDKKSDHLILNKKVDNSVIKTIDGLVIQLKNASSGIQSIVPLILIVDYLTNKIFEKKNTASFLETDYLRNELLEYLSHKKIEENDLIDKERQIKDLINIVSSRDYHYTQFFIEEPEQNLFPDTQKELIQHIIRACNNIEHEHQLFLTTHSHYILYIINNCILASKVKSKFSSDEIAGSLSSPVNSQHINIWEITTEGTISSIQDEDGLISRNYFDETMKDVMDEYYKLLEKFDEE